MRSNSHSTHYIYGIGNNVVQCRFFAKAPPFPKGKLEDRGEYKTNSGGKVHLAARIII